MLFGYDSKKKIVNYSVIGCYGEPLAVISHNYNVVSKEADIAKFCD